MMLVFFDNHGIIHIDYMPGGQTVIQIYNKEV